MPIPRYIADQYGRPGIFSRVFGLGGEQVNLNDQTAYFTMDRLAQFSGYDSTTPIGIIQARMFKPFHRALLSRYIIDSVTVRVPKNQRRQGLDYLIDKEVYSKHFYLHDKLNSDNQRSGSSGNLREYLYINWIKKIGAQPLDAIREYFGERLALYFSFCGFYVVWLFSAAIMGAAIIIVGLVDMSRHQESVTEIYSWRRIYDNVMMPYFALFMNIWATLFLEFWKVSFFLYKYTEAKPLPSIPLERIRL